jgi:hypothetical protein
MANLLPNIELHFPGTSKVLARLIFRSVLETESFTTKGTGPLAVLPLSFIYLGNMYWQKGKPFLFNNEVNEFSPKGIYCLDWIAFRLLYREILVAANILKSNPIQAAGDSNNLVNSLDYYVYGEAFYKSNLVGYENKIKELLDINALENHLNQAVRIENYAAAADIRNKIEAKGYNIVECHGRLIIRLGSPLAPEGGINKI